MIAKRMFDLFASGLGLFLLTPLFLVIALAIKLETPGPVFFRQERVGQGGKLFWIYKFRTMVRNAEQLGLQITVSDDRRVTRVGKLLRKYKLDELAQLINVLNGSMSLVGPRPEVPHYIAYYPDDVRVIVLSVKPGITDRASIEFRDESIILDRMEDPDKIYVHEVLPTKIRFYLDYVQTQTFWGDIRIIFATLRSLIS